MQGDQEVTMIKGKRSKRPRPPSPLALAIRTASSSSTADIGGGREFSGSSCYSWEEDEDLARCLILLAGSGPQAQRSSLYQCKTCNKSFPSFQALGGHRSSHKKPNNKPMNSLQEKPNNKSPSSPDSGSSTSPQNKYRVHECSLCGAEFASGQALGGHMRRHRPIPPPTASAESISHGESRQQVERPRNLLSVDLNLPAQEDDHSTESKFPFAAKEQVIVFSTSSLIDCHY